MNSSWQKLLKCDNQFVILLRSFHLILNSTEMSPHAGMFPKDKTEPEGTVRAKGGLDRTVRFLFSALSAAHEITDSQDKERKQQVIPSEDLLMEPISKGMFSLGGVK